MEQLYQEIAQYRKLNKRLFTLICFGLGVLVVVVLIWQYQSKLNTAERSELTRLSSIAHTLSSQIDGDLHQQLTDSVKLKNAILNNTDHPIYLQIHQQLKAAQQSNRLTTAVYTLIPFGNDFQFVVSSTNPYYRHIYFTAPAQLRSAFDKGDIIGQYEDENGLWLSAFAPIYNSKGHVVAVVMIDEQFDSFISDAQEELIFSLVTGSLALSIFVSMIFLWSSRFVNAMKDINKSLEEIVTIRTKELLEANEKLKVFNANLEEIVEDRTQKLQQTNDNLRASNEALTNFAYVVSHDLKEPLRMVSTYTQLVQRRIQQNKTANLDEFLNFIINGTEDMSTLINDLLNFSRIDASEKPRVNVNLMDILLKVQHNLSPTIQRRNAEIIIHDVLPSIEGDATLLNQLFQNLISNAIKFCKEDIPKVEIRAEQLEGFWQFSIKDNGVGIPEKNQVRAFDMFQRLHDRSEFKGTGIGLAICKKVVDKHGGKIWFESTVDKGTTFFFTFPVVH